MLTKVKPYAMPGGAILAFAAPYMKRAEASGIGVVDLVKDDIKNFDEREAMARLSAAIPAIAVPGIAGIAVKQTRLLGKASSIAADLLLGLAIGTAGKAILDPPELSHSMRSQRGGRIIDMQPQNGGYAARNPYEVI